MTDSSKSLCPRHKFAFTFQTFGETELEVALAESQSFIGELDSEAGCQRWLSLTGRSGTGKTFLMRQIKTMWRQVCSFAQPWEKMDMEWQWVNWPKVIGESMTRDRNLAGSIVDWMDYPVLFIDEIGIDRDKSGWVADALARLLSGRVGKATVLTSNCTLAQLEAIDGRIASRVIRDENRHVEIANTQDFAVRQMVEPARHQ